ncbi:cilia- and flagella-associated protein 70-like isoform X2 [Bolinopsis microptera]|uniref:cilia- and flagella-associated protein 70-like isoform X2 n=1 Tax=Bolinopsis microptera TaxID=2820187 RepID=UPI003078C071
MADKGGAPAGEEKRTSTIQIKIIQAKNLRGVKGDAVTAYARVEFGKTLGETNKAEIGPDGITKFNFNASIEVNLDDPSAIDEICHRLVLFHVIEVLPKEKKAREEKTAPIGQGVLDLSSLLKGENGFTQAVVIHSGTTAENVAANTGQNILQPELQVEVTVTNPLVSAEVYGVSNHMTIRVDSVYSLPETWQPSNNATHNFNAVMTVPLSDTVDVSVNAGAGSIRPAPEKNMDISSPQKVIPRRFASSNGLTGAVVHIPSSSVEGYVYEEEDGDLRVKEHHSFRKESEADKARVTWNSERNVFLLPSATETLQERIAKCRAWPMEIFRSSLSSGAKKGKDDDTATSCHGIAWVNLAPLLYPGVTRIKGAALIHPYIESEVLERTKKTTRSGTVSGEDSGQQRVSSGGSRRGVSSAKKGAKDSKKAAKEPVEGAEEPKNQEAQIYTEARSYVVVEIVLEKPLVSKRPPEQLAAKVAEYIPKRSSLTKHHCGADEAVSEYHKQIGDVANLVLNEYRQKFGVSNESTESDEVSDERKRSLIYDLNSSGKYFAFKEQLKQSVVKVVREKFFKTSAFQKEEELHQFLSELYVFLIEQMHKGVSQVFSLQNNAAPLPSPLDQNSLVHFAKEAELNQNYELAARYYQERLAMDQNSSSSWFDYGCFSLLVGNVSKAGECFRECLGLDQNYILALLMYGIVCVMEERYDVAETFFEDSTCVQPDNCLAWTVLGLFYDTRDNDIGAEMAFLEANKHFNRDDSSIFLASAATLLELHAYSLVESALSHELLSSPKTLNQEYYLLLAKLHMAKGELTEAESYVKQATVLNHTNPAGWALLGHILYLGGESKGARDNYERTLSYETPAPDTHSIRLRLASIYLQLQQYGAAKQMFLLACRDSPSCITWLGVGISCYRLGELSEAEQALSEANILNNTDPEVWGYLSLVCLKTSRKLEAEQSYKYALRVGLKDVDLLGEIKSIQKEVGFGDAGF